MNVPVLRSFGKCEFFRGDILEEIDRLPNESCQLIITSPPYNIGKEYESVSNLDEYLDWQKKLFQDYSPNLPTAGASFGRWAILCTREKLCRWIYVCIQYSMQTDLN